jgi:hypothetical protein
MLRGVHLLTLAGRGGAYEQHRSSNASAFGRWGVVRRHEINCCCRDDSSRFIDSRADRARFAFGRGFGYVSDDARECIADDSG